MTVINLTLACAENPEPYLSHFFASINENILVKVAKNLYSQKGSISFSNPVFCHSDFHSPERVLKGYLNESGFSFHPFNFKSTHKAYLTCKTRRQIISKFFDYSYFKRITKSKTEECLLWNDSVSNEVIPFLIFLG